MHLHRLPAFAVALLVVLVLTSVSIVPARAATSHSQQRVVTIAAVTETAKVTLSETSIASPALDSNGAAMIAWTGTDAAHRLNVMRISSDDGVHYRFADKRTLPETSFTAPAVTTYFDHVIVAWTGTDPNHSLNILYDVYGAHPQKLTFRNENSPYAPALAWTFVAEQSGSGPDFLVLAWTGTDANRSLNTLRINLTAGLKLDVKHTLPRVYNGVSGPTLGVVSPAPSTSYLLLSWAARVPADRITAVRSVDGVTWTTFLPASLAPERSAVAPSMQGRRVEDLAGVVDWAWTGTDARHTLNLLATIPLPETPTVGTPQKRTFWGETALGGPSLGTLGSLASPSRTFLAWTGTDAAHHLNIAAIAV